MNDADFALFAEANPDVDEIARAVLVRREDEWYLCIGETQSDGQFRHVDFRLDEADRYVPIMRMNLHSASPEGEAEFEAMIRKARGEGLHA